MRVTLIEIAIVAIFVLLAIAPALLPASLWFSATVRVPDHKVGDNPVVDYQRVIRKFAVLNWDVEIQPVGSGGANQQYCVGSGANIYAPDEARSFPLPLTLYAGVAECTLPPGAYVMNTCWRWTLWSIYPKAFCTQSNRFVVATDFD